MAEAFCHSDEQVRSAQTALDEAQAHRSRLLAAFAVTVGSDGAVAGVLGLQEREVRVARRTVGKEDARSVAEELLANSSKSSRQSAEQAEAAAQSAAQNTMTQNTMQNAAHNTAQQHAAPPADPGAGDPSVQHMSSMPAPPPEPPPAATDWSMEGMGMGMGTHPENQGAREPRWTGAMDALLVGSWQTGVDLQVLAAEFGLDLVRLVTRAQQLSAEGRLSPPWAGPGAGPETRSGRHRRNPGDADYPYEFYDTYGGHTTHGSGWEVPSTVPEEMLSSLPHQHSWPQYTHSATT